MKEKKHSLKYKNDFLLIAAILLIVGVCFIVFKATLRQGTSVTVSENGVVKYVYDITEDMEKIISTGVSGENILVIRDKKAFIKSANCPDKICVDHKAISSVGETIVCLPHKIVVSITDNQNK